MSAVQAGGGKGSGQKPGGAAGGRPAPGSKPKTSSGARPAGKAAPGRPAPATKAGPGGRSAGGGGKGPKQPGGYKPGAKPPARFNPSTMAFAVVALVVVIVVVFVVIKVTGSKTPASKAGQTAPQSVPASAAVVSQVTQVPTTVADAVGLPSTSTVAVPTVKKGQPPLTIAGKPGAVFIGGEFCPYCAAERWAMIMAFSKFGTFSNLKETTSSPWDADPSTATFSFYGSSYSSPYLTFDASEHESNDTTGLGTRTTLQPLTSVESKVWAKYDNPEGFPFIDIGNKYFVLAPSYDPAVLSGLDQEDIAAKLKNPKDPVTQAIVGTSNYLTAAICAVTGQKPATACAGSAVTKAAKALSAS